MEAFTSFFNSKSTSRSRWIYNTLIQDYLRQVYIALCCAVVASAVGAYLHVLLNIGGFLTMVASLASFIWLLCTTRSQEQKSMNLLMASALFQGASIGPLIDQAIQIDPRLIFSAVVGTSFALACFSVPVVTLVDRRMEHPSGWLCSVLSILIWLYIASTIVGGSIAIFKFELYLGFLVFGGYVILETQEMIIGLSFGGRDHVKNAMALFTDFAAIFVLILVMMLKNAVERFEKEERRD